MTTSAMWVDYTYTISRANQRVVGTRSPKKNCDPSCITGADTFQLSLTDGFKVTQQLENEASARTQPFMWAALVVLWIYIGFQVFPKKAMNSLVLCPAWLLAGSSESRNQFQSTRKGFPCPPMWLNPVSSTRVHEKQFEFLDHIAFRIVAQLVVRLGQALQEALLKRRIRFVLSLDDAARIAVPRFAR
jgi:hypothetical protein